VHKKQQNIAEIRNSGEKGSGNIPRKREAHTRRAVPPRTLAHVSATRKGEEKKGEACCSSNGGKTAINQNLSFELRDHIRAGRSLSSLTEKGKHVW